jgi:hypothetical protein
MAVSLYILPKDNLALASPSKLAHSALILGPATFFLQQPLANAYLLANT